MRTVEHPKKCPPGYRWRKIGARQHPDYTIKYWKNNGPSRYVSIGSLTLARKDAANLIREGSASVVEIFRYAESGVSIIPVLQSSYEA